jgi:hypothetical protein
MRDVHGHLPALAVLGNSPGCYRWGMKLNPHRNSDINHAAESSDLRTRSVRERGMHATNARPPPAITYRRYPSLSDDGQPYFPRLRRTRRSENETFTVANSSADSGSSPFLSVRVIALLAIIVIIATLVANAS